MTDETLIAESERLVTLYDTTETTAKGVKRGKNDEKDDE